MCIAAATFGLIAKGASVGLTALSAYSQYQQGQAAEKQANLDAKALNAKVARDVETQVREDRYREGQEIVDIAGSGVSGSFGSPFLVAIENAENAAINRGNFLRAGINQADQIRTAGANAAAQGTNALFGGFAGAAVEGFKGFQSYKKTRQNALYLGDSTIPGIV